MKSTDSLTLSKNKSSAPSQYLLIDNYVILLVKKKLKHILITINNDKKRKNNPDVDWANRLIIGDSLLIMNSLLNKEGMAGK